MLMFGELGKSDDSWAGACADALAVELASASPSLVAVVVDGEEGQLAACGVAYLDRRLPGPGGGPPLQGHIGSMYTEVASRRQGHGRAVLRFLLDWCWDRGVQRVQLWASEMGAPLYASEGFYIGNPLWQLQRPRERA
jgi:GNAT superfamily N-acetyltransferase